MAAFLRDCRRERTPISKETHDEAKRLVDAMRDEISPDHRLWADLREVREAATVSPTEGGAMVGATGSELEAYMNRAARAGSRTVDSGGERAFAEGEDDLLERMLWNANVPNGP